MATIQTKGPGGKPTSKVRAGRPKLPEHQRFAAFELQLLAEALLDNDHEHIMRSLESLPEFGFRVEIVEPHPEWRRRS